MVLSYKHQIINNTQIYWVYKLPFLIQVIYVQWHRENVSLHLDSVIIVMTNINVVFTVKVNI